MKTSNLIMLTRLSNETRMTGEPVITMQERRADELKELGEQDGRGHEFWKDVMTKIDTIHGLIDLIEKVDIKDKVIVEVGSFLGISTETFLLHEPKKMYAIDPWGLDVDYHESDAFTKDHGGWDGVEQKFRDRVKDYKNIEIIKNFSVEAAKNFEEESLDFVYIDGNHEWQYVAEDILAWWPKIKQNGYIGGHDFYSSSGLGHMAGVEGTVYHYFGHEGHLNNHVETFSDSSWLFKKIQK